MNRQVKGLLAQHIFYIPVIYIYNVKIRSAHGNETDKTNDAL